MDFLSCDRIRTNLDGGRAQHRPNVIRLLDTLLGMPRNIVLVCEDRRTQSGTIVTTHTDQHETRRKTRQLQSSARGEW